MKHNSKIATTLESGKRSVMDYLFVLILPGTVAAFLGLGIAMRGVESLVVLPQKAAPQAIRTTFELQRTAEKPKPMPPKPIVKKNESQKTEPVDLTTKPKLAQKTDDPQEPQPDKKPVRRVYGLRKVYSKGIGAGGAMDDAVVGKLGNTINKDFDTTTASEEEIKGRIVSTTTVTKAPRFKKRAKPAYTEAMLEHKVEGVVRVKVLVDVDGKVKKALALNDIGFTAAKQAIQASLQMEFFPAQRGDEPVAVWIVVPIRFVMLS